MDGYAFRPMVYNIHVYVYYGSIHSDHSLNIQAKRIIPQPPPPVTWIGLIGLRGTVVTWVLLYLHR